MAASETTTGPKLVDTTRAAERLGLTRRALEERRRRGGGPRYIRVSATCVRYDVRDLEQWVDERRYASTAEEQADQGRPPEAA